MGRLERDVASVVRPAVTGPGLCHCGCGQRTALAKRNYPHRGLLKGDPLPYLPSHQKRLRQVWIVVRGESDSWAELRLPRGVIRVDITDVETAMWQTWHISKHSGYPTAKTPQGVRTLHQFLLGGGYVDHADRDRLNNRRLNLRVSTHQQNTCNRTAVGGTSRYKGVCQPTNEKCWRAAIGVKRRTIYLGSFKSEKEAALAYDDAARILHGEYAVLNFPEKVSHESVG